MSAPLQRVASGLSQVVHDLAGAYRRGVHPGEAVQDHVALGLSSHAWDAGQHAVGFQA